MKSFLRMIKKKKIKDLQSEKNRGHHKVKLLLEENKALKKLAQIPLEDQIAREIAKRELVMENKKKRRYVQQEQPQVRKPLEKVYFQEGEESESSGEEITKVKCKKSKKNTKEASSSSESSSEEDSEQQKQSKHKNKKKIKCQNTYKKKLK